MIKPAVLKKGDTLGIVACSTPITVCAADARERAYRRLEALGFKLKEAENCRKTFGHAAGTIQERVASLHAMFADPNVNGIISFWGGFQSHQLLEYLDYDLIKKNPKPFIGFSDTTSLQIGIYAKTGLVTFSGPSVVTFAMPEVPEYTLEHFTKILLSPVVPFKVGVSENFSDNPWYKEAERKMFFKTNPGLRIFKHGKATGITTGGNIGTMLLLAGTEFWPDLRGKILFAEEDEVENTKTVDRMFTQLRQMGVFNEIAGLVVGRFPSSAGFDEDDSLEMILDDALKGYDFPVITGADFGHTQPLMTIPIGIQCSINTSGPEIVFLESGVE